MKKPTLLILIVLFTGLTVKAQTLVDTNKVWRGVETLVGAYSWTHSYIFQGDTTLGSYQYKKLYATFDSALTNWSYRGSMREDSTKKVYFIESSNEYLLYDFGLNQNDTFTTAINGGCNIQMVVDSVDSVALLNGEFRKRLFLSWPPETWIDGVGSLFGLDHVGFYNCTLDEEATLNCFTEDSILKYHDSSFNDCYFIQTGIKESATSLACTVIPNPFSDYTIVSWKNPEKETRALMIYDLRGQLVKAYSGITSERVKIDKSGLSEGYYLFQLWNEKRILANGKLIVQ